jgi:hypothetical protein
MHLVLSLADLDRLRPDSRADVLACLGLPTPTQDAPKPLAQAPQVDDEQSGLADFDFDDDVVDLTPDQAADFVKGISPETVAGLRVFAAHGPVIDVTLLNGAGITNYTHFQGRLSKRTRTITGKKHAVLLVTPQEDDWLWDEQGLTLLSGRYAVSMQTCRSLRQVFGL